MSFKNIHIGEMIKERVRECEIDVSRICNFFKCTEDDIASIYENPDIDTGHLLRWSKLLEYDFFRVYSHHLILYAPPSAAKKMTDTKKKSALPSFRKNVYTKEVIDFILEEITTGGKTKQQVTDEYRIPKTTLYKWISKYKN